MVTPVDEVVAVEPATARPSQKRPGRYLAADRGQLTCVGAEEETTTLRVAGGPNAAGAARQAVHRRLEGRLSDAREADLQLIVSELVSNSVRHGDAGPDTTIVIELIVGERLRISVIDAGPGFTPSADAPDLSSPGGLGLLLVKQLSFAWGVTRVDGRTRVWSELAS